MNNKRATKRALLTSVMALVMCVVMLAGTTFAWFTDTASTGVNKIQAGNLKVDIVDKEGTTSLDGKSLSFVKAGLTTDTEITPAAEILWEPGCRYLTQGFRIANKGNLALKWKAVVNKGTTAANDGGFDLLDVIDFYLVTSRDVNDMGTPLAEFTGNLKKTEISDVYYIKGVMKTTAGNDYQGLTLDGISITVYATQYTHENDSFGPNYDANATYYPVLDAAGMKDALVNGGNIKVDANVDVGADALVVAKDTTIDANGKTLTTTADIWDESKMDWSLISVRGGKTLTITGNGTFKAKENDSFAVDVQDGATVTIENGTFIGNVHAVYVYEGTAYIKGGFYSVQQKYNVAGKENEFVLNCYDANRNADTAKIIVTGGTFVNFNPADCWAEGAHTNFVADGYSVIREDKANGDKWYTVVKGTGVVPGNQADLNNGITQPDAATPSKDVTVVMPASSTFTLDNGIANSSGSDNKARDITFVGDGTQTVNVATEVVGENNNKLNYQRGSTFTFENLTIQAGEGSFEGIVCDELTYKNCTIKGKLTLYGKATFINCVFENTMANQYSIWTWGGTDVTFEKCTFNTNGKAILLYGGAVASAPPTNLVVNNCTFNDRNNGNAGKAAIEIGNDYNATYTLTVNNATVNGFADGKNTGSKLWANKNSMDAAHLTVTIDGNKVQ